MDKPAKIIVKIELFLYYATATIPKEIYLIILYDPPKSFNR